MYDGGVEQIGKEVDFVVLKTNTKSMIEVKKVVFSNV